jgi:hypothetical protein
MSIFLEARLIKPVSYARCSNSFLEMPSTLSKSNNFGAEIFFHDKGYLINFVIVHILLLKNK